jgi:diguanylate cyclase (GGDEF)-like protein
MAATDPLTGLSNRRSFDQNADSVIRNSRDQGDSALLIFDLDRLKAINDSFGHSMGDRALTTFGEVAAKSIRNEDFLARIGGDEFALLLTRVDSVRAVAVAERIRSAYGAAAAALGDGLASVSVGIALSGHETPDLSALKEEADKALYVAKSGGRNQVFVAQR